MASQERILVTGANGYIGRHVVTELLRQDHQVLALVRPGQNATFRSSFQLNSALNRAVSTKPELLTVVEADLLTDPITAANLALTDDFAATAAIHLAWRDGFKHNSPNHVLDLSDHFRFLSRLIELGLPRLSVLGSVHEIGYWEGPVDENTPSNPISLYGIAKDTLRRSMFAINGEQTSLRWLRCYYITGDDQRNNSIFTRIREAAAAGMSSFPFTSGKNRFDFIEIDELATQICVAALAANASGIINCASGRPVTLAERVSTFISEQRLSITPEYGAYPDRPYDSPGIWADSTTIQRLLAERWSNGSLN